MQIPPPEELTKAKDMTTSLRAQLKVLFDALPLDPNSAIRFEAGEEQ